MPTSFLATLVGNWVARVLNYGSSELASLFAPQAFKINMELKSLRNSFELYYSYRWFFYQLYIDLQSCIVKPLKVMQERCRNIVIPFISTICTTSFLMVPKAVIFWPFYKLAESCSGGGKKPAVRRLLFYIPPIHRKGNWSKSNPSPSLIYILQWSRLLYFSKYQLLIILNLYSLLGPVFFSDCDN